jgi:ribosome-binding protein aMBF1 (putative translation factor)
MNTCSASDAAELSPTYDFSWYQDEVLDQGTLATQFCVATEPTIDLEQAEFNLLIEQFGPELFTAPSKNQESFQNVTKRTASSDADQKITKVRAKIVKSHNDSDAAQLIAYGKHVRELRLNTPYNQRELAKAAKVSESLISEVENGKKKFGPISCEKVARALGVTYEELAQV